MIRGLILLLFVMMPALLWGQTVFTQHYVREPVFDVDVFIQEAGRGHDQTIVLVHGIGDRGSKDWEKLMPILAKQYHVLAFDLPGFGKSGKGNLYYSPEKYTAVLKWIIDRYGMTTKQGKVILAGHSMGGAIALRYASLYPTTLSRLILVDVAGVLQRSLFSRAAARISLEKDSPWEKVLGGSVEKVNGWISNVVGKFESSSVSFEKILQDSSLREQWLKGDPATIAGLALVQENFAPVIANMNVPTFIIWGRDDPIAPLRTGELLQYRLANAQLDVIDHTAHVPMMQNAKAFNRLFLKNLLRSDVQSITKKAARQTIDKDKKRIGSCRKNNHLYFSGKYERITIDGCRGVVLENVSAQYVGISLSQVEIKNSRIISEGVGMKVFASRVVATGLDIEADVAVKSSKSELDFASVFIKARQAVTAGAWATRVIFSVSRVDSQYSSGYRHEVVNVGRRSPL